MLSPRAFETQPEYLSALLVDLQHGSDTDPPRLIVSGEVDAVSAAELREACAEVLDRHQPTSIVVDLHGVTFVDSVGIRTLLLCHADAQRMDCCLTITRPQPPVYRVLQITALLEHLGVADPKPREESPAERAGWSH
jgi:anti-anti-sigma factor